MGIMTGSEGVVGLEIVVEVVVDRTGDISFFSCLGGDLFLLSSTVLSFLGFLDDEDWCEDC
jgi:hypothetical protein